MPNFAFRKNKFSTGPRLIVDLIIDKVNQFESFKEGLEKNQLKKLNVISSSILQISENRTLPQNKHRKLHSKFDIYEFKSGDLRLYYTKTKGGQSFHWEVIKTIKPRTSKKWNQSVKS